VTEVGGNHIRDWPI